MQTSPTRNDRGLDVWFLIEVRDGILVKANHISHDLVIKRWEPEHRKTLDRRQIHTISAITLCQYQAPLLPKEFSTPDPSHLFLRGCALCAGGGIHALTEGRNSSREITRLLPLFGFNLDQFWKVHCNCLPSTWVSQSMMQRVFPTAPF